MSTIKTLANSKTHSVAFTILQQLGHGTFRLMSGAYNFSASKNSLSMTLRKNNLRAKYLSIVYNEGDDLYSMIFMSKDLAVLKQYDGVYSDMLQDIFQDETGLIIKVRFIAA